MGGHQESSQAVSLPVLEANHCAGKKEAGLPGGIGQGWEAESAQEQECRVGCRRDRRQDRRHEGESTEG